MHGKRAGSATRLSLERLECRSYLSVLSGHLSARDKDKQHQEDVAAQLHSDQEPAVQQAINGRSVNDRSATGHSSGPAELRAEGPDAPPSGPVDTRPDTRGQTSARHGHGAEPAAESGISFVDGSLDGIADSVSHEPRELLVTPIAAIRSPASGIAPSASVSPRSDVGSQDDHRQSGRIADESRVLPGVDPSSASHHDRSSTPDDGAFIANESEGSDLRRTVETLSDEQVTETPQIHSLVEHDDPLSQGLVASSPTGLAQREEYDLLDGPVESPTDRHGSNDRSGSPIVAPEEDAQFASSPSDAGVTFVEPIWLGERENAERDIPTARELPVGRRDSEDASDQTEAHSGNGPSETSADKELNLEAESFAIPRDGEPRTLLSSSDTKSPDAQSPIESGNNARGHSRAGTDDGTRESPTSSDTVGKQRSHAADPLAPSGLARSDISAKNETSSYVPNQPLDEYSGRPTKQEADVESPSSQEAIGRSSKGEKAESQDGRITDPDVDKPQHADPRVRDEHAGPDTAGASDVVGGRPLEAVDKRAPDKAHSGVPPQAADPGNSETTAPTGDAGGKSRAADAGSNKNPDSDTGIAAAAGDGRKNSHGEKPFSSSATGKKSDIEEPGASQQDGTSASNLHRGGSEKHAASKSTSLNSDGAETSPLQHGNPDDGHGPSPDNNGDAGKKQALIANDGSNGSHASERRKHDDAPTQKKTNTADPDQESKHSPHTPGNDREGKEAKHDPQPTFSNDSVEPEKEVRGNQHKAPHLADEGVGAENKSDQARKHQASENEDRSSADASGSSKHNSQYPSTNKDSLEKAKESSEQSPLGGESSKSEKKPEKTEKYKLDEHEATNIGDGHAAPPNTAGKPTREDHAEPSKENHSLVIGDKEKDKDLSPKQSKANDIGKQEKDPSSEGNDESSQSSDVHGPTSEQLPRHPASPNSKNERSNSNAGPGSDTVNDQPQIGENQSDRSDLKDGPKEKGPGQDKPKFAVDDSMGHGPSASNGSTSEPSNDSEDAKAGRELLKSNPKTFPDSGDSNESGATPVQDSDNTTHPVAENSATFDQPVPGKTEQHGQNSVHPDRRSDEAVGQHGDSDSKHDVPHGTVEVGQSASQTPETADNGLIARNSPSGPIPDRQPSRDQSYAVTEQAQPIAPVVDGSSVKSGAIPNRIETHAGPRENFSSDSSSDGPIDGRLGAAFASIGHTDAYFTSAPLANLASSDEGAPAARGGDAAITITARREGAAHWAATDLAFAQEATEALSTQQIIARNMAVTTDVAGQPEFSQIFELRIGNKSAVEGAFAAAFIQGLDLITQILPFDLDSLESSFASLLEQLQRIDFELDSQSMQGICLGSLAAAALIACYIARRQGQQFETTTALVLSDGSVLGVAPFSF